MRKPDKFDPKKGDPLPDALLVGASKVRKRISAEGYHVKDRNASEHVIQCATARFLDAIIDPMPDCIWWAVPNGGIRPGVVIGTDANGNERRISKEGQKLRDEGLKPGVADIHILWRGRLLAIEMKKKGGYQSDNQKDWELDATAAGAVYVVCRSVPEVAEVLDALGIYHKS
jgi:hypothetical protein